MFCFGPTVASFHVRGPDSPPLRAFPTVVGSIETETQLRHRSYLKGAHISKFNLIPHSESLQYNYFRTLCNKRYLLQLRHFQKRNISNGFQQHVPPNQSTVSIWHRLPEADRWRGRKRRREHIDRHFRKRHQCSFISVRDDQSPNWRFGDLPTKPLVHCLPSSNKLRLDEQQARHACATHPWRTNNGHSVSAKLRHYVPNFSWKDLERPTLSHGRCFECFPPVSQSDRSQTTKPRFISGQTCLSWDMQWCSCGLRIDCISRGSRVSKTIWQFQGRSRRIERRRFRPNIVGLANVRLWQTDCVEFTIFQWIQRGNLRPGRVGARCGSHWIWFQSFQMEILEAQTGNLGSTGKGRSIRFIRFFFWWLPGGSTLEGILPTVPSVYEKQRWASQWHSYGGGLAYLHFLVFICIIKLSLI